jgi:hypothetical protein
MSLAMKRKSCPITGKPILYKSLGRPPHPQVASLHKKIPKRGYVETNVDILSHEGNSVLNRFPPRLLRQAYLYALRYQR